MAGPVTSYAGVIVEERGTGDSQPWPTLLALLGLWVLNINQLHVEWTVNPQYTFGWTVPFLSLYLFAERWKDRPCTSPIGFRPVLCALLIVIGLCLLPLRLIEEAAPDWRTANWAMAAASALVTLIAVYYSGGRKWLFHFAFPICFLLIAVPWPVPLEKILIQKLMTVVSAACIEALSFFSIPAVQDGNVIVISTGKVGVEEACSGVRSLQTTLMAALFLGELFRFSLIRRASLLIAGLAIAFLCNLGRSFALVWISVHQSTAAAHSWHDWIGNAVLVASLVGLAVLCALLRPRSHSDDPPPEVPDAPPWRPRFAPRWVLIGAMVWLGAVELANEAWYRSHEKVEKATPWTIRWPTERKDFRDIPLGEATRSMLRFDEGRSVAWVEPNGFQCFVNFLRWAPGRASKQLARSHGPEVCLPASGLVLRADYGVKPVRAAGLDLPMHSYLFTVRNGTPLFVFYCLWEDHAAADGPQSTRADMTMETRMRDVLNGRRNNGQQVIELAVFGPRSPEEASTTVARLLDSLIKS